MSVITLQVNLIRIESQTQCIDSRGSIDQHAFSECNQYCPDPSGNNHHHTDDERTNRGGGYSPEGRSGHHQHHPVTGLTATSAGPADNDDSDEHDEESDTD